MLPRRLLAGPKSPLCTSEWNWGAAPPQAMQLCLCRPLKVTVNSHPAPDAYCFIARRPLFVHGWSSGSRCYQLIEPRVVNEVGFVWSTDIETVYHCLNERVVAGRDAPRSRLPNAVVARFTNCKHASNMLSLNGPLGVRALTPCELTIRAGVVQVRFKWFAVVKRL